MVAVKAISGSVANPVVAVLPAPAAGGQVLVVTLHLFACGSPAVPGELVYYRTL